MLREGKYQMKIMKQSVGSLIRDLVYLMQLEPQQNSLFDMLSGANVYSGVPGCGKTYDIIEKSSAASCFIAMTR